MMGHNKTKETWITFHKNKKVEMKQLESDFDKMIKMLNNSWKGGSNGTK